MKTKELIIAMASALNMDANELAAGYAAFLTDYNTTTNK